MRVAVLGLRGFPLIEGGVEKHCESLYPRMKKIDVIVFRRKSYVKTNKSYPNIKFVDLFSTRIKGFETVLHSFLATRRALKMRPDVVHIHNIGPAMFSGMLRKKNIPVVLTYHSPNYEHDKWGTLAKKLLRYSEKIALKNASRIIFVNRFQMDRYSNAIKKKSFFIPNGINEPNFSYSTSYLSKIGVEKGKYILSVGRITQEKGFDTLIKAFNASKHVGCKLVIAGGVEFESKYMKELKKMAGNDVIFTGFVHGEKLEQLYTNAALFVLASNNEGFPLVLLEAMSYGLDVLVSDIPATHLVDLCDNDYFPKGNYKELSQKITERLVSPKKREYELKEFDWNTVANKTIVAYKEVLHNENLNGEQILIS